MGYKSFDVSGGTYKLYTTNLVPSNRILMIYKGDTLEHSGYVF
jgi:hypothetical protein